MTFRFRTPTAAVAVLLAAVLTACSSDSGGSDEGHDRTRDGSDAVSVSHIHGLGIDPADGRLYVATHHGVIAVDKDGDAERVGDQSDYMGFTVTGESTFLGSGHPEEGSGEPAHRGLIKSTDAGKTWKTLSLGGEADFHALEYAHNTVYGYDSTRGQVRVSKDGKRWDDRAKIPAIDLAVSPKNPGLVLATTQQGVAKSTNGGNTFAEGAGPTLVFISWAATPDALYGIDPHGAVHRSTDNGKTWKKTGTVPGGGPQALTVIDAKHVLAATENGVYESRDGGKTFTERLSAS
ncbi:F510_1955 family glycosylhydrolase [Streptomyces gobiensis]|uniref:F510_1955 family glycosylhydrolase n=1 Tax=Streptomyces gobiensis TaxID=2875706 RepID=UPI001E611488|nr:sialidase family protein [Streptomyces gobiensis]UGY93638.1 glycoside hydrolase [Streptomyces gobiensis]